MFKLEAVKFDPMGMPLDHFKLTHDPTNHFSTPVQCSGEITACISYTERINENEFSKYDNVVRLN